MSDLRNELLQAARGWRKRPALAGAAVVTIALAIGVATAAFAVVNGLLIRPLPYAAPDRLVALSTNALTTANASEWRAALPSLETFATYTLGSAVRSDVEGSEEVHWIGGSGAFFRVLGTVPGRGRLYTESDDVPNADAVVVISHALARTLFGEDADATGRGITLEGRTYEIIGVLPPDFSFFRFGSRYDVYVPLATAPVRARPRPASLSAFGHLRPGTSVARVQAEAHAVAGRMPLAPGEPDRESFARVELMAEAMVGEFRTVVLFMLAATLLVLLIACINVAHLLLARGIARRTELSVRLALGASRSILVRQLLSECGLLVAVGGILGVVLAWWTSDLVAALAPQIFPRRQHIALDGRVVAFALVTTAGAILLAGLGPSMAAERSAAGNGLGSLARATSSVRSALLRDALIATEVALAVVVLCGTLLVVRTFLALRPVEPGFAVADRLAVSLRMPQHVLATDEGRVSFARAVLQRTTMLPGSPAAALATDIPLTGNTDLRAVRAIDGVAVDTLARPRLVHFRSVTPGYLELMEMRLLSGRTLRDTDDARAQPVLVVNRSAARRLFPDVADPVGRSVVLDVGAPVAFTIVGLLEDARVHGGILRGQSEVFASWWQQPMMRTTLVLHDAARAGIDATAVRGILADTDPGTAFNGLTTLRSIAHESVEWPRFQALVITVFGVLAALLAVIGCHGVLTFAVSQRTREIGVRMALGARGSHVTDLLLRRVMYVVGAGTLLGLLAAAASTRVLESALFGVVPPRDPATFAAAGLMLIVLTLGATLLPARRALSIPPTEALRSD